jgi:glucans biosynthesis protein
MTNSFADTNPKGFGLIQRDRDFANYQDDGAFYEKRPESGWSPRELGRRRSATGGDSHRRRNPRQYRCLLAARSRRPSGDSMSFDYRSTGRTTSRLIQIHCQGGWNPAGTRRHTGQNPWPRDKHKFVVDFTGGPLMQMKQRYDVKPMVTASRGSVDNAYVVKVVGTDRWRALFDLKVDGNGRSICACS